MVPQQLVDWFHSLSPEVVSRFLRVAATAVIGLFAVRLVGLFVRRMFTKKSSPQRRMIARKVVNYTGFVLVTMIVLSELGVQISALLGAAGIVGIAVGFASQTSMSNIVSGLFLIWEKPFALGDVIRIGSTTGIIQSIDLLSIKIRTFDNLFVRIPNERILSSEVTNITRFPIRRMDIVLQVAYREDLNRVHEVLTAIARESRYSLDEPEPLVMFTDFKDSGIEVLFGLWFAKADFVNLKNSIMKDITARFRAEGIEIPFPHRVIVQAPEDGGPASPGLAVTQAPPAGAARDT
jgi:small-conductance mechanosensitive channel